MKSIHIHHIVVDYKSKEMLSADTDFYAYIGEQQQYNTFDKFIHPDCHERFWAIVEGRDTNPFVIDMSKDGNRFPAYMRISYGKSNMSIDLEPVDELREGQEIYRKLNELNQDILGLHNDIMFSYSAKTENISFYTSDFRRCTKNIPIDNFIEEIRGNINEADYEKLDKLLLAIKSESGSFAYTFKGKIFDHMEECKNSIVKGIAVKGYELFDTVGYVHRGSNKGEASFTVEKDALTGTYSKREIANIARKTIEVEKQPNIAICILDVDFFKSVNDNFGHQMGDKVLQEIADIIKTEVGNNGVVGRFGGDEFFVMFYDVEDMELCREKLRGIKNCVGTRFPKSVDNSTVHVTLSIGCAVYPADADNYNDLFSLADYCLYLAKDKGRNRYIIYNREKHGALSEIKDYFNNNRRIDTRKDLAMGDVLCMIEDQHYNDEAYTPEMLIDDLVENLPVERIICLAGSPLKNRCMSGINLPDEKTIDEFAGSLEKIASDEMFNNDVLIIDDFEKVKNIDEALYQSCINMNTQSLVLVRFKDKAGLVSYVSLEMTTTKFAWNRSNTYNYRTIARKFGRYEL